MAGGGTIVDLLAVFGFFVVVFGTTGFRTTTASAAFGVDDHCFVADELVVKRCVGTVGFGASFHVVAGFAVVSVFSASQHTPK